MVPTPSQVQELVQRACAGEDLFDELEAVLNPRLRSLLCKRWGCHDEAAREITARVLSDGFLKLRSGGYDPERSRFTTFLHRMAHDAWVDEMRRKKSRRETSLSSLEDFEIDKVEDFDEGSHSLDFDEVEAMHGCLYEKNSENALSDEERLIVVERSHGETFETLKKRLKRSLDTVFRRYQSGLEKLRRCLRGKGVLDEGVE